MVVVQISMKGTISSEENLSAAQTPSQQCTRFPSKDEDSRGPQGHRAASCARSQSADARVGCGFPKSRRLLRGSDFGRVMRASRKTAGEYLVIQMLWRADGKPCRLGLAVSTKYGDAHLRNRFKRLCREAFRQTPLPMGYDIIVKPRTAALTATYHDVADDLWRCITGG